MRLMKKLPVHTHIMERNVEDFGATVRRPVQIDGKVFQSTREACKKLKIAYKTFHNMVREGKAKKLV